MSNQHTREIVFDGIYKHYKGRKYKLLYVAKHSETLEDMIIYQALYDDFKIWVRPSSMFFGNVEIDGKEVHRFEFVAPSLSSLFKN